MVVADVPGWRSTEPALSRGSLTGPVEGPEWVLELSERIAGYRTATSIESYMAAVAAELRRDEQDLTPLFNAFAPAAAPPLPLWRRMGSKAVAGTAATVTAAAGAAFHAELEQAFTAAITWATIAVSIACAETVLTLEDLLDDLACSGAGGRCVPSADLGHGGSARTRRETD